jgi:protein O-mannosyl-transferase
MQGLLLALAGFLLYANSLTHDFVLDDVSAIKKNWVVKQGVVSFPTILTTSYRYGYRSSDDELYRPLPLMVFAALWEFFPENPFVFHLLNVLLYAITGVLLFRVLKKILRDYNPLLPFIASALFIVHPLHAEVVANIKSIDEILSFLFVLLSVEQLFRYVEMKKRRSLALAWMFFFFAFLSKEGTIVMLAIIPLILAMFSRAGKKEIAGITLMLSTAAIIFIVMRANALGGMETGKAFSIQENVLVSAPNAAIRFATILSVMLLYIRLMLVPYPLSSDYSFSQMELSAWIQPWPWISLVFYAGITVLAIRLYRTQRIVSFAILFFLCSIVLYSNILMTIGSLFAERFLYVPLLGFSIFAAWMLMKVSGIPVTSVHGNTADKIFHAENRKPLALLALFVIPFSVISIARSADWKDTVTLFSKDVVNAPNSALLHFNYANELKAERAAKETEANLRNAILDSAIAHYRRALEIHPGYTEVFEQLGLAYYYRGMDSAAFQNVRKAIEAEPLRSTAYNSLGTLYFERAKNYQKALELYLHAVKLNPNYIDGWRNVGAAYGTLGQFDKAIGAFQQVLRLDPVNVTVLNFLAQTYKSMGDEASANLYLQKAAAAERNR